MKDISRKTFENMRYRKHVIDFDDLPNYIDKIVGISFYSNSYTLYYLIGKIKSVTSAYVVFYGKAVEVQFDTTNNSIYNKRMLEQSYLATLNHNNTLYHNVNGECKMMFKEIFQD